jgi:chromate transporter
MNSKLKEVFLVFFKLGCLAFGGPAAHVAMMEDEIVKKRKWISQQHFLDLIGATNLIPGPNSTEMTMHCGHERAGIKGLFVAGASFIFPAVVITMIFAWLYESYGNLPAVEPFIYGIKPAVLAIILATVFRLAKKALKNSQLIILGIITLVAAYLGVHEMIALFTCGLLGIVLYSLKRNKDKLYSFAWLGFFPLFGTISKTVIFLIFLKVGAFLYGGGYVLFAYLDAELVSNGLLTQQQLMDAIAVGQFTPGPILSTATFIGWQLGGFWGSILATLGIFLPSFVFVGILNPLVPKMRKSKWISSFLDAVNAAAVAIILGVCIKMGQEILIQWETIVIGLFSAIVVFGFKKVHTVYIVLGGSILGYLLHLV